MIRLLFIRVKEGTDQVEFTHHAPFHSEYGLGKTIGELDKEGFVTDKPIPTPEVLENHNPVLHFNETEGFYYNYEEVKGIPVDPNSPVNSQANMEQLRQRLEMAEKVLDDILLGGGGL